MILLSGTTHVAANFISILIRHHLSNLCQLFPKGFYLFGARANELIIDEARRLSNRGCQFSVGVFRIAVTKAK